MNRIKKLMNQITNQGWVTIISIIATIGIIGISVWLFTPKQTQNIDEQDVSEDDLIESALESLFTKEEINTDSQGVSSYIRNTQEVQVAVVMDNSYMEEPTNGVCGQITFVTTRVTGPAVLTNTLHALFSDTIDTDFTPGNIIPMYHPELSFDRATINNGNARIYVTGTFSGSNDAWCDSDLAIAQIAETAKGFSTINSVEIFQNSVKIY